MDRVRKRSMRGGKVVQSPPHQCCKAQEKGRATTALSLLLGDPWHMYLTPTFHPSQGGLGIRGCNNVEEKESTKSNYIMNTSIHISLNTGSGMG